MPSLTPPRRRQSIGIECGLCHAQCQLRQEVVDGEESLDAVTFLTIGIKNQNGWRPLGVVVFAETLVFVLLLANVDANWLQLIGNEVRHSWIGVHLGFKPSAARSHRGGSEVEQDAARVCACPRERGIEIRRPDDRR